MSFKTVAGGKEIACVGSLIGEANIELYNSNFVSDVRSDKMTVLGSLWGSSKVDMRNLSMNLTAAGDKAYAFGGLNGCTELSVDSADMQIKLNSKLERITSAKCESLKLGDGRYRVTFNDKEIMVTPNI